MLDMRHARLEGGELADGPALQLTPAGTTPLTLRENRIGPNRVGEGMALVRLQASSDDTGTVDIEGNTFTGDVEPLMDLEIAGQLAGVIRCNFVGGTVGLEVHTGHAGSQGFALDTNSFELHSVTGIRSTAALEAGNN